MNPTTGTRVLLGVGGGIAAYKAADLVRRLREQGCDVRVVLTHAAGQFVSPLSFQALSGHPARSALLDPAAEAGMDHIELARWAERLVIAPATADLIARLAAGLADDLLTTLALATEAPVLLAPAMNRVMWQHPATQANLATLVGRGVRVLGPASGSQACGESGPGRLLEPGEIAARVCEPPEPRPVQFLADKRVLITAGPTREPIDPVRFIGNRSSGRMGYALAEALGELGAHVVLVSGPTGLTDPRVGAIVRVETALEMHEAVMTRVEDCDLFVATAAVADYRPERPASAKLKKSAEVLEVRLVRNPDILADVAARPEPPFTVGFAAETHDLEVHALHKLAAKGIDMIAANRVAGDEGGFEREDNALTVLWADGRRELELMPKHRLARALAGLIAERFHASA
jgi:phosphopantothenoylcysteine decarboxylase/phosphopantothenate--cysteine ligase